MNALALGPPRLVVPPTGPAGTAVPTTPVATVRCGSRRRGTEILLKLEQANPMGSIKDRTAQGLVADLELRGLLPPGACVVESTSGNLGLALAALLCPRGYEFLAVVDTKTPSATCSAMLAEGATLECVDTPDAVGGFLLTRLRRVREILQSRPGTVWTDQYHNPANPRIHAATTGPEILAQAAPGVDAIYLAVSTGGTLAGVATHLRGLGYPARLIAVDLVVSAVISPPPVVPGGIRLIPGIGASRSSTFLRPWMYDAVRRVSDAEGIAICRMLWEDTGLLVGGSSGCVLAAVWRDVITGMADGRVLAVCPDGGQRYADTIFDDGWLDRQRIAGQVAAVAAALRGAGLRFERSS